MYNNEKEAFQTIYIFNADEGDTITIDHPEPLSWTTDSTYRLVIEQIDTVLVDGIALKKYRTSGLDAFNFINNGGYFMDRIGGLDWFFPRGSITLESGGPIRCYTDNEIDTNFQSIACDYHLINNTTENEFNHDISVFPNPFQNQLIIQAKQPIQKSVLFDLSGRKIYVSAQKQLNLAHCKQGVYLLKICLESGTTVNKTIVKHGL